MRLFPHDRHDLLLSDSPGGDLRCPCRESKLGRRPGGSLRRTSCCIYKVLGVYEEAAHLHLLVTVQLTIMKLSHSAQLLVGVLFGILAKVLASPTEGAVGGAPDSFLDIGENAIAPGKN